MASIEDKGQGTSLSSRSGAAAVEHERVVSFHADKVSGTIRVGAFSYTQGGHFADVSIGRYCAFAPGVQLGLDEHPTNWLSVSSFQYGGALLRLWGQAAENSGKPFQPAQIRGRPPIVLGGRIEIGHDVWLGQDVFVSPRVTIGHGAIAAGRAVVTKDVAPYAIVGGCPARLIRYRFDEKVVERLLAVRWWQYAMWDIMDLPFNDVPRALDLLEERAASAKIQVYEPGFSSVRL